jgi:hypothetical protein
MAEPRTIAETSVRVVVEVVDRFVESVSDIGFLLILGIDCWVFVRRDEMLRRGVEPSLPLDRRKQRSIGKKKIFFWKNKPPSFHPGMGKELILLTNLVLIIAFR